MKILFAVPDRDLLECCKKLLEDDLGETVGAFDGTQVMSLLSEEKFDVLILDRQIPRVDYKKITERAQRRSVPVIVLTDEPVGTRQLNEEPLPNGWLSYPFTSGRIRETVRDALEKSSSSDRMIFGDVEVVIPEFRINNGPRLTLDEINVLKALSDGGSVTTDDGASVSALNGKFASVGSKTRIRYRAGKGFEPVNEDD